MKIRLRSLAIAISLCVVTGCPFIGFDHYIGDHDIGDFWETFIKYPPSLKFKFHNPAQIGLDILPFEELSEIRKMKMRRYCKVRYWIDDIKECYRIVYKNRY